MLKKLLYFLPIIVLCILLFVFSSENSDVSGGRSKNLIKSFVTTSCTIFQKMGYIDNMPSDAMIDAIVRNSEYPVRKLAHITLYFLLGIIAMIILCKATKIKYSHACLICMAFCCAVGIFDEFHQVFVSGRSGEILDVFIDSCGALLGILIYDLIRYINKAINC